MAGGGHHLHRAAVVDLEGVVGRAGEEAVEVDEEVGVGAGVAVDDLVVVADAEHVEGGRGQQAQEQDVGRGEVLELVDEEVAAPGLGPPAEVAVGQEQLDGGVDLLVEVDRAPVGEGLAEGGEGLGQAGDVVAGVLDRHGVAQAEADEGQAVEVGTDGIGVDPPLRAGDEARHEVADVALVEDGGGPAPGVGEQGEAEGVEGADPGPERPAALLHLLPGLLVVGDGEDGLRLDAPVDDEVAQPLGEHPGLARPGRRDHPGRAGAVGDRRQLVGGEDGVGRGPAAEPWSAARGPPTRRGRGPCRRGW